MSSALGHTKLPRLNEREKETREVKNSSQKSSWVNLNTIIFLTLILATALFHTEPSSGWCMCRVWSPFLQPPVYCLPVWQCKMSTTAMMISLFKTLHRFVEWRHATGCGTRGRRKGRGKKEKKQSMFGVILSLGPDVVLALLFCSLQRKHTLIQTIWEVCQTQNIL